MASPSCWPNRRRGPRARGGANDGYRDVRWARRGAGRRVGNWNVRGNQSGDSLEQAWFQSFDPIVCFLVGFGLEFPASRFTVLVGLELVGRKSSSSASSSSTKSTSTQTSKDTTTTPTGAAEPTSTAEATTPETPPAVATETSARDVGPAPTTQEPATAPSKTESPVTQPTAIVPNRGSSDLNGVVPQTDSSAHLHVDHRLGNSLHPATLASPPSPLLRPTTVAPLSTAEDAVTTTSVMEPAVDAMLRRFSRKPPHLFSPACWHR